VNPLHLQPTNRYFPASKGEKVKTERKIICIKEQMDFYKYMLSSEHYDLDEKKKAKEGLEKLMGKLNDMSDHQIDVINGMCLCS
jgi:hypothetical protein